MHEHLNKDYFRVRHYGIAAIENIFALENLQQSKEAKEACVQVTLASEWLFLNDHLSIV